MSITFDFSGRSALVTGVARTGQIGYSVARALASLFIHRSAAKIETAPNTAAMPIMVIALPLTAPKPLAPFLLGRG